MNNNKEQMELGFNGVAVCGMSEERRLKLGRAQWWFSQMRRAVNCAMEWKPAPGARPEQIHMKLSERW